MMITDEKTAKEVLKNIDVLKAWAEGRPIQFKFKNESAWRTFISGQGILPAFANNESYDWRVKPEARKIWVMEDTNGRLLVVDRENHIDGETPYIKRIHGPFELED